VASQGGGRSEVAARGQCGVVVWFALQCLGQQEVRQEAFSAGKMGPQSWTPPLPDVLCLTKTLKALNEILEWTDTILP